MLATPSGQEGLWLSVGFSDTTLPYDVGPTHVEKHRSGVEVYVVDQRPSSCGNNHEPCRGRARSVTPHPVNQSDPMSLMHVLNPGQRIIWNGIAVIGGLNGNNIFVGPWWFYPYAGAVTLWC